MKLLQLFIALSFALSIQAQPTVQNVILLIGDGMGIAQIQANRMLNHGVSVFDEFPYTGLSRTASADNDVTDSGAGGTALATGKKTKNHRIGVDTSDQPLTNLLELSKKKNKSTGLVVTCDVTHATPASFIAHVPSRYQEEDIATFYLNGNIDFFMGSGQKFFDSRKDKVNLLPELKKQNFYIVKETEQADSSKTYNKVGWFIPGSGCPDSLRPNFLPQGVRWGIKQLSKDTDGFFMMVEGSQIDWAGHENDLPCMHRQMNEFEQAVAAALAFAKENKNTLVIVTADHETGGLSIQGSYKNEVKSSFVYTTKDHTGTPVGVFAYGPGAQAFSGYYENTEIFTKIKLLLEL